MTSADPKLDQAIFDRLNGTGEFLDRNVVRKESQMSNDNAQEAAAEAVDLLAPFSADLPDEMLSDLKLVADGNVPGEPDEDDEPSDERLAKALGELSELEAVTKSESRESLRVAVQKARAKMEAEYLAHVSPTAAAKAEEMRAVRR